MDSIRECLTKEDILSGIRMERAEDIKDEKCFVIVEGSDDACFVKMTFSDNVVCIESFAGKSGLQEIVEEESLDDVIGIRDKDYVDKKSLPDRVFLYDHCCLEIMLLVNTCVVRNYFYVYYKGRCGCDSYLINAMRQLAPYSLLRMKNEIEALGINFQRSRFGDLIDISKETLDNEELFRRAKAWERYADCKREAEELNDSMLPEVTNGHDICRFLGRLSKNGTKSIDEAGVRNALLVSYRREDFKETQLYHSIFCYQRQKGLNFLN